jgi:DNA repair exonuclease SbcCD nuclease subunit
MSKTGKKTSSKNKVLIFTDIHLACHKKRTDRLHDCLKALEWVFETAKANDVKHLLFGGDLFQDRQKIDILTYHLTFDLFHKYCDGSIDVTLLLGNHDLWYYDSWDVHSVRPFSALKGVTLVDQPKTLEIAGHKVDFLPYTHKPLEHLDNLSKTGGRKLLLAHLAVDGAILNNNYSTYSDVIIEHDGDMVRVGAGVFDDWDQVFLGHYHCEQRLTPRVEYVGSPLELTFGEAYQKKHVLIYDLATGERKYVTNDFSPKHLIIPEEDAHKYDLTGNFVRLTVADKSQSRIAEMKDELRSKNPGSVEVVSDCKVEADQQQVDESKLVIANEDEMLRMWIKASNSGLDEGRLLDTGRKVCLYQPQETA